MSVCDCACVFIFTQTKKDWTLYLKEESAGSFFMTEIRRVNKPFFPSHTRFLENQTFINGWHQPGKKTQNHLWEPLMHIWLYLSVLTSASTSGIFALSEIALSSFNSWLLRSRYLFLKVGQTAANLQRGACQDTTQDTWRTLPKPWETVVTFKRRHGSALTSSTETWSAEKLQTETCWVAWLTLLLGLLWVSIKTKLDALQVHTKINNIMHLNHRDISTTM